MSTGKAILIALLGVVTAAVVAIIGVELPFAVAWGLAAAAAGAAVVIGGAADAILALEPPPVDEPRGLRDDVRQLSAGFDQRSGRARHAVRIRAHRVVVAALREHGVDPAAPNAPERAAALFGPAARALLQGDAALTVTALDDLLTRLERSDPSRKEHS